MWLKSVYEIPIETVTYKYKKCKDNFENSTRYISE